MAWGVSVFTLSSSQVDSFKNGGYSHKPQIKFQQSIQGGFSDCEAV